MVDLRVFANDLMGKTIKPRHHMGGNHADGDYIVSKHEYTIEAVYPYYVRCNRVVNEENGYIERECFNIGDLVMMGMLHSIGARLYTPTAKGVREPHGHGGNEWKDRRWTY